MCLASYTLTLHSHTHSLHTSHLPYYEASPDVAAQTWTFQDPKLWVKIKLLSLYGTQSQVSCYSKTKQPKILGFKSWICHLLLLLLVIMVVVAVSCAVVQTPLSCVLHGVYQSHSEWLHPCFLQGSWLKNAPLGLPASLPSSPTHVLWPFQITYLYSNLCLSICFWTNWDNTVIISIIIPISSENWGTER
jgi:hypothetical protein